MKSVDRRAFVTGAGALALAGCTPENAAGGGGKSAGKSYKWKMGTTWSPTFPVLQDSAKNIAKWIAEMSGGRMQIEVYGANELIPALDVFENVGLGAIEMGHGAAYYWKGKVAAAPFFTSVPFGMNAQQMNAWLYHGGGLEIWQKTYAPHNVVPMPIGNTGVQMGGWFRKEINSIADIKGLKMRIPGIGGDVFTAAGGSAELIAGPEIYNALQLGQIDATEWIGPYHDQLQGFHNIAQYYYYPGWHEPGSVMELTINKQAWDGLDSELQAIITSAAVRSNMTMLSQFEAQNNAALVELVEKNVNLKRFPDDVLATFRSLTDDVLTDLAGKDAFAKEAYDSFSTFRKQANGWAPYSELAYYDHIAGLASKT
ncbi:MAG: TRAP-type mannitol/chloroaromatic compound transport system substrate-binding protein [Rhodothermales bacterium]|jgi:TRAP-type mannitol/chloroaromatic compound transport system substrate-binding protein